MDEARVTVSAGVKSVSLRLPWDATLAEVMSRACEELGQGDDGWELSCEDGTTMMNKLGRTLGELRDRRICPRREFELSAPPDSPARGSDSPPGGDGRPGDTGPEPAGAGPVRGRRKPGG